MRGYRTVYAIGAALALLAAGALQHDAVAETGTSAPASITAPAPVAEPSPPVPEEDTAVETAATPSGRLMVPIMIGSSGPHDFIVDTAAERSVIARELAESLKLAPAGRSSILSMTSTRVIDKVVVPDFSFASSPPTTIHAFEFSRHNIGAAGVLGIDILKGRRAVLDFKAQEVRVGPAPPKSARLEPNEIVIYGRTRFGQLVLADADVSGQHVEVIIDSGLSVSLGNEALRRLLVTRSNKFQKIALASVTGETLAADYTQVDRLRIGGVAIKGMPIAFADAYFFQRLRLTRQPTLLLGIDTLKYFDRVTVDFQNRRAQFVLPANPAP